MRVENVQSPPVGSEYYVFKPGKQADPSEAVSNQEQMQQQPRAIPRENENELGPLKVLSDSKNMLEFVKSFNRFLRTIDNSYSIRYHRKAAREYVIIKDVMTNQVLNQYPSEDMLELIAQIRAVLWSVFIGTHPHQVDKRI